MDWRIGVFGENIGTLKNPEIELQKPRIGVTIVGVLATWWVGFITGICLSFVGLIHKTVKVMFQVTIKAFILTIIIAILAGIIGFGFGQLFLADSYSNNFIPDHVIERGKFASVGSIHNFSYLGGLIGLVIAILFSIRQKTKMISID